MKQISLLVTAILLCNSWATAQNANKPPSMEEIRQSYSTEQFPQTLSMIAKVIALKGKAADSYDFYELNMMRGECHWRLKNVREACSAFAAAAKVAEEDSTKADLANATEMLARLSPSLLYKVRHVEKGSDSSKTLSVVGKAERKAALNALFKDELAEQRVKIKAAAKSTAIAPIVDAIKSVLQIKTLEVAATGQAVQSDEYLSDLGENAHKLISTEVTQLRKSLRDIRWSGSARRGLDSRQLQQIKEIVSESSKIQSLCQEFEQIAKKLGKKGRDFSTLANQTDDIHRRALAIRNINVGYEH